MLYGLNKLFTSKNNLIGQNFSIDSYLREMKTGKRYDYKSLAYDKLNMYFLNRSMHQLNEACNKLWTTMEAHYAATGKNKLCKKFSPDFLPSSTIPTLHYANISAILSILSLFGLTSIASKGRNLIFYNLVRTSCGILLMERNKYIQTTLGSVKSGWHAQVLQTYAGIQTKLEMPEINISECKKLQSERSKFHYDILSQTNMKGFSGMQTYFQFLPLVTNTIKNAIQSYHQVINPIPNGCDSRFEELKTKMSLVVKEYNLKVRE